jgi:ribose 5-phosphate isomerase B
VRVYLGSDHAGFELKQQLVEHVRELGHEPVDCGAPAYDAEDDYPPYIIETATRVAGDPGSAGIVLGGSGNGEAIAANKVRGIRCALAFSPDTARLAREHNDANVLVLPARFVSQDEGVEILQTWLATEFAGGRHSRRVAKIDQEQG